MVSASASYEKTLTSPNYPSDHDNYLICNWLLEVDSGVPTNGYIVKVTFSGFSLECDDELNLYDGNSTGSNLLGSYCGSTPPEVIYSTGRYLYVNFHTDDFYALKGFNLSFSAVKEGTVVRYLICCFCYLRNRKHVPCFYRVIETRVEVCENEKCCGNTSR